MPIFGNSGDLVTYIAGLIPDNNAGQISAADVRNSIVDTVRSINFIVSSGNFEINPFVNNVKILKTDGQNNGILIVGSGVQFSTGAVQTVPYPGPQSINHNQLDNLGVGDFHPQYMPVSGNRTFTGNIGFRNHWLNSSGNSNIESTTGKGLQFSYVSPSRENINVGSGTRFTFLNDGSMLNSARGAAKAWIRFQASGIGGDGRPLVLDSYNVSGLRKESVGQFTIIFNSGVFKDNNYAAIGHSNGRSAAGSREDFSENTVALAYRIGDDAQKLRSVSFVVMGEDTGAYLDGTVNDLVVFGTEPGGSGTTTVSINPSY